MKPHIILTALLVTGLYLVAHGCAATSGETPAQEMGSTSAAVGGGIVGTIATGNPITGFGIGWLCKMIARFFQNLVPFERHSFDGLPPPDTGWSFGTYVLIALALLGAWIVLHRTGKFSLDWLAGVKEARHVARRMKA